MEANLSWWVDGPGGHVGRVHPSVRDLVGQLQRRAEIRVPTLVLVGGLDLDAILDAARRVADGIPGARRTDWPDAAHLPSMERPDDFLTLLVDWLAT